MARSEDIRAQANALAKIEAAYKALDDLPPKIARLVRTQAAQTYLAHGVEDALAEVRKALATEPPGAEVLADAARKLADLVDGGEED